MKQRSYYYLNTNGDLIYKNAVVVQYPHEYFEGPFVKKWWQFDPQDRADAWRVTLEALAFGMRVSRAKELVDKWGLTIKDFYEFMMRNTSPNQALTDGITVFAEKVLEIDIDDFWDKVGKYNKETENV